MLQPPGTMLRMVSGCSPWVNVAVARTLGHDIASGGQNTIGSPDACTATKNALISQNIGPMRKTRRT
jgi:hypothetical protein